MPIQHRICKLKVYSSNFPGSKLTPQEQEKSQRQLPAYGLFSFSFIKDDREFKDWVGQTATSGAKLGIPPTKLP